MPSDDFREAPSQGRGPARQGRPISIEKRLALEEAAIEEFSEVGFDLASVDAIAARAGVSKRTLYNHFSSKDVLFTALVDEVGQRISLSTTIRYNPTVPLREQLMAFIREARRLVRQPRTLRLLRAVLAEHIRRPERVEPILKNYWRAEYGIRTWTTSACRNGRLQGDPTRIAHALRTMMQSLVFWPSVLGRLHPRSPAFKVETDDAIDMFLAFYAPRHAKDESGIA